MSGQAIDGDHANPAIDAVQDAGGLPLQQVGAQAADLDERPCVKESVETGGDRDGLIQRQRPEPRRNLFRRRRGEPRLDQHAREWIDVVAQWPAAEQRRLEQRRPAPHERVEHDVARAREPTDEEPRQLRLEAGTVGDLVEGMRRPLPGRPELVGEHRDAVVLADDRRRAEPAPVLELAGQLAAGHGPRIQKDCAAAWRAPALPPTGRARPRPARPRPAPPDRRCAGPSL